MVFVKNVGQDRAAGSRGDRCHARCPGRPRRSVRQDRYDRPSGGFGRAGFSFSMGPGNGSLCPLVELPAVMSHPDRVPPLVVRSNFRVGVAMLLAAVAALALGLLLLWQAQPGWLVVPAAVLAGLGACWTWAALWYLFLPRLELRGKELWIRLHPAHRAQIPLEHVEAFLLNQGPAMPQQQLRDKALATCLVVRVAEKAHPWSQLRMASLLAVWCGPYITLRGTWLEPLTIDKVNRLNELLYQAKQSAEAKTADEPSGTDEATAPAGQRA